MVATVAWFIAPLAMLHIRTRTDDDMRIIGVILVAMGLGLTGVAQEFDEYEHRELVYRGDTLPYRILYPKDYDHNKTYPVVFFLHGAGERGNNNNAQLTHGAKLFLDDTVRQAFPAIVVFPQCPSDSFWANVSIEPREGGGRDFLFQQKGKPSKAMAMLLRLTKHILKEEAVDKSRVYLGGLSMGAMGTFELLRRRPKMFAAAFAICGGDNTRNVAKYAHVPLWIFHGEKDEVVPPDHSRVLVYHLQQLGKEPRYTFYPDVNHNSWDPAFAEPDLLPWLFSHSK